MGSIRGRAGYGELLLNPDLRRWYENVRRGSPITADVYLRRLGATCLKKGLTPTALAEQPTSNGERWAFNFLADLVTEMEGEGKAGSYIASNVKAVKSWLSHNGVQVAGKIRIKGARETPSLATKHAPSLAELRGLFANCSPRTRSAAALIAEAGLRLESIGNYYGTDGLTVGDIPEMKIFHNDEGSQSEGALVMFSRIPTIVIVRQELSKAGHQYFTFLTREGCGFLAEYLTQRIKSGERLDPSSPLLAPDEYHNSRTNLFLRTTLVSRLIRYRLRSCRIAARPYDLRSSFDTHLMLAESNGVIIRDYRVFFMGHKGDIEHTYTTNKRVLQPNVVEDMRSSFAKAQRFLQSTESIPEGPSLRDETYKRMLVLAGFTEKEIVEQRLLEVGDDQVAQKAREKLFSASKFLVVFLKELLSVERAADEVGKELLPPLVLLFVFAPVAPVGRDPSPCDVVVVDHHVPEALRVSLVDLVLNLGQRRLLDCHDEVPEVDAPELFLQLDGPFDRAGVVPLHAVDAL